MIFHLDESVDGVIGRSLRRHKIDVTISAEVGLLKASDPEQLEFAIRE